MGIARKKFETTRDAATVLLGLGGVSAAISVGLLLISLAGGYGVVGWGAYYIGPATLLVATLLLPPGMHLSRQATKMRLNLDRETDDV